MQKESKVRKSKWQKKYASNKVSKESEDEEEFYDVYYASQNSDNPI